MAGCVSPTRWDGDAGMPKIRQPLCKDVPKKAHQRWGVAPPPTLQHISSWQTCLTGGQIQKRVMWSTHLRWGTVPEQQRSSAARWQPQQRRG